MGVRGFTTYISKHSHLFQESFELKNCYVVIDGSGVSISLYIRHTKSNDCYGGDYDNYAETVYKFFNLLKKCNVTPIILFDGGYESRKLKTVFKRMRNRIGSIKRLNSSTVQDIKVFPLFTREIFQDIALSLGIKCIRNDHESDSEIACLGRYLDCPILGYDSDFYFFDALYIPFDTFQMKFDSSYDEESKTCENYIPCQVYNIDFFLSYFGGLDKSTLPLLPVLLGNDYVKKSLFSAFHRQIKMKKSKSQNEQQRLISSVINWLKNETLESAISKILGRFKAKKRRFISFKLKSAMRGYQQVSSTITDYLQDMDLTFYEKEEYNIDIENIKPTFEANEVENGSDSGTDEEEVTSDSSEGSNSVLDDVKSDEISDSLTKVYLESTKSEDQNNEELYFVDRYRRCDLPRCFAEIKWRNTNFCIPQVESYADPNSHRISFDILSSFHKILTSSVKTPFICVLRGEGMVVKKERLKEYSGELPGLADIPNLSESDRKRFFLQILKIDEAFQEFLIMFPSSWHVYLISLYYWKKNSKKVIDTSYFYSLLICAIVLNLVDPKIGFCRSSRIFNRKYKNKNLQNQKSKPLALTTIEELFEKIGYGECVLCLKAFLDFFSIQPKKSIDKKLDEAIIVGYFSEFQSCALHIKFLNNLLCFPFEDLIFSKFFCGTFLYNTVVDFRRRSDLKSYLKLLFTNCESILQSVNMMMLYIQQYFGELCESSATKLRRRKRKNRNKVEVREHEGQFVLDNFYSETEI